MRERDYSPSRKKSTSDSRRRHGNHGRGDERDDRRRRHDDNDDRRESGPHRERKQHFRNEPDQERRRRRDEEEEDTRNQRQRHDQQRRIDKNRKRRPENNEDEQAGSSSQQVWGKREMKTEKETEDEEGPPIEKEKPNFGLSGKLVEDTNKFNGVVIKYNEPPEARKPKLRWRLYPFKEDETLEALYIHRQSAYLIGRDRRIADIPIDHPSCSKQHAVFQYRVMPYEREDGSRGKQVRPYVIDLGSANGTYLNNERIEAERYYEVMEKDVIKFGFSSREYVLLHENSHQVEDNESPSGNNDS